MNSWIKGLKEYNKGSDSWCIPKKGSKGYNNIMNKKKPITFKESPPPEPTKIVIPKKPYTFKEIQEMRKKSEKFAKEDSKNRRNKIAKIVGAGKYASRSKEPSTPFDYDKEQKEHEEMIKRYYKPGKKLGVLL